MGCFAKSFTYDPMNPGKSMVLRASVAVLLGIALLSDDVSPASAGAAAAPASKPLPFAGAIDLPTDEATLSRSAFIAGWALDVAGIRAVTLRFANGDSVPARYGVPRPDVAAAMPGYPNGSLGGGFEVRHQLADPRPLRQPFTIVATDAKGADHVLGRRSFIPPDALQLWSAAAPPKPSSRAAPFHFLIALSGVSHGAASEIAAVYRNYASSTQRIGMAVPILYLRTTKGRAGDWMFDADFDLTRKCGQQPLAEDSLNLVLRRAIELRMPVQFILNGGIWADATCNDPEWDLNDHLEESPENCQWSQDNRVFPDDYLKNLAGATTSPELARSLTFNVYAAKVRSYKRRNLQAAARRIAQFAREHPDLFVGVNLDSDAYINPFFEEREWFDYNPGTLRQFREWLRGDGPYAGSAGEGVPNLRAWRRKDPLTLSQVNKLARRDWKSWAEVEPPRRFPGSKRDALRPGETPIWDDPWYRVWDAFRKHLVAVNYADLARWTHEAGIPRDRIFTAMGFVAPEGTSRPFAQYVTSGGQNYDSGGVSVEGAIPADGHLGAILYGASAENRVTMEERHGLFATFARMDPSWAVVEMNTADLRRPEILPTYAQAYRSFRDLFNYDARQVAVMAWTGSNGIYAGQPGYISYTSWRNTPAEEAMRDYMVAHANLPAHSRLWTFGSAQHADDDGWSVEGGALEASRARITVRATGTQTQVTLISPGDQVIRRTTAGRFVLGVSSEFKGDAEIWAQQQPGSPWRRLGATRTGDRTMTPAGLIVKLSWPPDWPSGALIERLKIVVSSSALAQGVTIDRIALINAR
jgi:hypothetical protein